LAGLVVGILVAVFVPVPPFDPNVHAHEVKGALHPVTGKFGIVYVDRRSSPAKIASMFVLAGAFVGLALKLVVIFVQKKRDMSQADEKPD
jgi:hypothetical protein